MKSNHAYLQPKFLLSLIGSAVFVGYGLIGPMVQGIVEPVFTKSASYSVVASPGKASPFESRLTTFKVTNKF